MKRSRIVLAAVLLAACEGKVSAPGGGACVKNQNDLIRQKLEKTCAPCHAAGSYPFFASLDTFEATLAYNPKWVTPGHPESSPMSLLLHGQGTGTFNQMPPGESYAALEARGAAPMPLADIDAWIATLPPQTSAFEGPNPNAATIRRLTAEEMTTSLMQQIGLELTDFVYVPSNTPDWASQPLQIPGGSFFLYPPDKSPTVWSGYGSDSDSMRRFEALGGPNSLAYQSRSKDLTPAALQVIVQMSQAWCSRAIAKPNNTTFFSAASKTDTSAAAPDKIRQNIGALYVSMLGEAPSDDDIDELFTNVFKVYEPKGTNIAWTAVCSALIRHPKWVNF